MPYEEGVARDRKSASIGNAEKKVQMLHENIDN
jgi:hypothetical protein